MAERRSINSQAFTYNPRLKKVKQFIDAHFSEPVSLETVSGIAGLERTYFSKFFHEKTGIRFRDWLSAVRVRRAMDIMIARDAPITEIAYEAGFQDLRTFERAVERCTGLSPKVVKRRLRACAASRVLNSSNDFPIADGFFTTYAERS